MKKIKGQCYIDFSDASSIEEVQRLFLLNYEQAHGKTYVKYLLKIKEMLADCESYRELGTNQGASAFFAVDTSIKILDLVDVSFIGMKTNKLVLDSYAQQNDKIINYFEISSLKTNIDYNCDFLFIDSLHEFDHVKKEITKYHSLTKKYIMFHDTTLYPEIFSAVTWFLDTNKEWEILEIENSFAGHTIIKRK